MKSGSIISRPASIINSIVRHRPDPALLISSPFLPRPWSRAHLSEDAFATTRLSILSKSRNSWCNFCPRFSHANEIVVKLYCTVVFRSMSRRSFQRPDTLVLLNRRREALATVIQSFDGYEDTARGN